MTPLRKNMASDYKIFWTHEAIENLESILDYLNDRWTQREIDNFKNKLTEQIRLIEQNPKLFPVSQYNPRLRKAVLSKAISFHQTVKSFTVTFTHWYQGFSYFDTVSFNTFNFIDSNDE